MRPWPCGYCGFVLGVAMRAMSSSMPYNSKAMCQTVSLGQLLLCASAYRLHYSTQHSLS